MRSSVVAAYAKLSQAFHMSMRQSGAAKTYAALFEPSYLGFSPGAFAKAATTPTRDGAAAQIESTGSTHASTGSAMPSIMPVARSRLAALRDGIHATRRVFSPPSEQPSIFERLFGKPAPLALAYAAPDDTGLGAGNSLSGGRYDRSTAVYDISARTVYLPDGTQLEAHSGFGPWLDDPNHTELRMRGATPATVYDLQLRTGLFHGVQALRLIPQDEAKVFGRTGLLAHTFMLGSNGQSNGCVSFRNYDAFLRAYLRGEIKRLAVVARLD